MVLRIAAPKQGTASVIILHGLGDSGAGWEFLARELHRRPAMSHVNFVLPSAPLRPITAANGQAMPAWFDLSTIGSVNIADRSSGDAEGVSKTLEYVKKLVNDEVNLGIPTERILVGGFSQGGAITMAVAATFKQKLAGLLSMSGFVPVPDYLETIASPANKDTQFLLTHGTVDPIVPFVKGKKSFDILRQQFGLSAIEFEAFNGMQHTVDPDCLKKITAFIERVLN